MKKNIFLLLLCCFSSVFYAQNIPFTITKSMVFQDDYKNSNILLSEINEKNELVLVRSYDGTSVFSQGQGFYIEKYDSRLDLKKSFDFEIKHPNYEKNNIMIGIFTMQNKIHFVEICYDLNEKAFVCFDNIMTEDFKVTKKELFKLPREVMKQIGSFNLQQKFYERRKGIWTNNNSGVIKSEDEFAYLNAFNRAFSLGPNFSNFNYKKVLDIENKGIGSDAILVVNESKTAFAIAIDGKSDENDGLQLYLFDENSNKKFDVMYGNGVKDKKSFFQNILISDEGDAIYLVAKAYAPNLKKKEEGGKYFFDISKITANSQSSQKIEVGEHYIGSLKTCFHNNELVSFGFYSDNQENKYSGICHFKLDPNTLTVKSSKYNPFTAQFLVDKYGSETYKALKTISFKKTFFNSNDEIIINAEEAYVTEYFNNPGVAAAVVVGVMPSYSINYTYDDIIIAKLNNDGELLWARNINKKQSTGDEDNGFLSYTSVFCNDKNYFFVNSRDKIKKLTNDRIEFRQIRKNKSNLNMITVNSNGDFEYQEILDDQENSLPFMVSRGININNFVYFLGRKGTDKQLLKVTL